MIAYSSYLPKKTDIVNSAFITAFSNHGFELFAAIGVFSILGFMAHSQGVAVAEVAGQGVGLAFVVFPKAISALPALNGIIGAAFFTTLFFAGLTSSISIIEAFLAGIMDKFNLPRQKALNICTGIAFTISILFATNAGLYVLDIVDYFVNNFGIVISGLLQVILVGWFFNLEGLRQHANEYYDFAIGPWWNAMIKYVTPAFLGYMTIQNIIENIQKPYEGYPLSALLTMGWGVVATCIVLAILFYSMKGSANMLLKPGKEVGR